MEEWRLLFRLGLNEYQGKALACLIDRGDLTAQEVSEESGVPYSKVYSVLKSLSSMGLLIATGKRPKRYVSRSEEEVVNFLVNRKRMEFERIKKQGKVAKKELQAMKCVGPNQGVFKQQTL